MPPPLLRAFALLVCAALLASSARADAPSRTKSNAHSARSTYAHMTVIEPDADLDRFSVDHAALLDETERGAVIPTYRITDALREMLAQGPVAAVRRGQDVVLTPRLPGSGAQARVIPLNDRKAPWSVALDAETAVRLQALIDGGDVGGAHALLQRNFDGAAELSAASVEPALTFEKAREALWRALNFQKYEEAVEAAKQVVRLAPTESDRKIYQIMLEQAQALGDAQKLVQARRFKEASRLYADFAERWPQQAGMPLSIKDRLDRFEALLPESDGPQASGAELARKMIAKLPENPRDLPSRRTPETEKMILDFRRLMRPLTGLDLQPLDSPSPDDLARFLEFAHTLVQAGRSRSFGRLAASFSSDDPSPGSGEPNSLVAFGLIKYADRPTQDAFGVHDLHE